jgi:hypothetical protein
MTITFSSRTQLHGVTNLSSWNSVVGNIAMQSRLCSSQLTTSQFCRATRRRVLTSGVAAVRNKTRKLIHFKCIITGRTKCCWVPDVTRRTCDNACPTTWHWWQRHRLHCVRHQGNTRLPLFFPARGPNQPWDPRSVLYGGERFPLRTGNEADQPPSTTSGVKNTWSHTSTPSYVFVAWYLKQGDIPVFPSNIMSSEAKIGKCVQLR